MPAQKRRRFIIRKKRKLREKRIKRLIATARKRLPESQYKIKQELKTRNGIKYYLCENNGYLGIVDGTISANGKVLISERIKPKILREAAAHHEAAELEYAKNTPARKFSMEKGHKLGLEAEKNFILGYGSKRDIELWQKYRKLLEKFWKLVSPHQIKERGIIWNSMKKILEEWEK
ncbi:MAG: hypothetical protein AB1467_01670 [Candidatus Diapherotrites archaeon]